MKRCAAERACIHRDRFYERDEELIIGDKDEVPEHFVFVANVKEEDLPAPEVPMLSPDPIKIPPGDPLGKSTDKAADKPKDKAKAKTKPAEEDPPAGPPAPEVPTA
ncbi:MAG: hypothetical protein P4N59_07435 [Negativicutes bacterium]|nr:hypothetical protein [Negativicutes bacterium]